MITVKKAFEVETQGREKKVLTPEQLTGFAIWLVEAVNNPEVKDLYLADELFAWRISGAEPTSRSAEHIYLSGQEEGMDLLHARNLIDMIDNLAGQDELLEDTYPGFTDHPAQGALAGRYLVTPFNDGKLLGFLDMKESMSILPVALKVRPSGKSYEIVTYDEVKRPWYKFNR